MQINIYMCDYVWFTHTLLYLFVCIPKNVFHDDHHPRSNLVDAWNVCQQDNCNDTGTVCEINFVPVD